MRPPSDPNYDKSTLYIPQKEWVAFSPSMVQYWKVKCKNYDSIVFFKLGKFYELFYEDSIICHRVLDLNWMNTNPQKLHVGFPEKNREKYAKTLVDLHYRVIVVE